MKYLLTNQETARLKFRKLEPSDFETWLDLFKDDEVTRLLAMSEYKTPAERCEKWFEWTFHRYENDLGGQNVLIAKENNELIGQCGLLAKEVEGAFELEIAYSILPRHRLNGYAIEAAKKCRDFAFENVYHDRLVSIITPENLNSKKVALKNGMKFSRQIDHNGKKVDLYQVNIEDWKPALDNIGWQVE